jgi:tetratricopeptide (TPR) repeat protein
LRVKYRDLVVAYRKAGVDRAEQILRRWDERQLSEAIDSVGSLDAEWRLSEGWTPALCASALVLHIDIYLTRAKAGTIAAPQMDYALRLLKRSPRLGVSEDVQRRSAVLIAWLLHIGGDVENLRPHITRSVDRFPDSPELLMALGVLQEAAALPPLGGRPGLAAISGLEAAAHTYRRVLAIAPGSVEAQLRLGYALLQLGRTDDARTALTSALQGASESRLAYLAALFLGRLEESKDRLPQALSRYRQARATAPKCQVAGFALCNALRLADQPAAAADLARELAETGGSGCEDPWWTYQYGEAWRLEAELEALRLRVRE